MPALEVDVYASRRSDFFEEDSRCKAIFERQSKYPNCGQTSDASRCIAHCKLSINLDAQIKLPSLAEIGHCELSVFQACSSGPAAFFPKDLTCVDVIPLSYYNKYIFPILRPVVILVESNIPESKDHLSLRQALENSDRLALVQLRSLTIQTCIIHQRVSCNVCLQEILAVTVGSSAIVQKELRHWIPDFNPDCLVGIFVQYR